MKIILCNIILGLSIVCSHSMTAAILNTGSNDTCETAFEIFCNDTINGSTIGMTDTNGFNGPDSFYIYTEAAPMGSNVTFSLCDGADFDTLMRIYTDCDLTNSIQNDDSCGLASEITISTTVGETYYIAIEGFSGQSGDFTITASCAAPPPPPIPPPNDEIENSIFIGDGGFNYTDPNVNMPNATAEGANTMGCTLDGFDGVWYHFSTFNDPISSVIATIESPGGVQSAIFFEAPNDSPSIEDLVRVEQNTNPCFTGASASITIENDSYYYVFIANTGNVTNVLIETQMIFGIEESTFKRVTLYPNPTSEILNIEATSVIEQIVIRNLLGAVILESDINATSSSISTGTMAIGSYILTATIDGISTNYNFIKK